MKKFMSLVLGLLLVCTAGVALAEAEAAGTDAVLVAEDKAGELIVKPGDTLEFDVVLTPAETDQIMRIGIDAGEAPVKFVSAIGGEVNDTVPPQGLDGYFVVFNADGLSLTPDGTTLEGTSYTVAALEEGKVGKLTFMVDTIAGVGTYTVKTFVDFGAGAVEGTVTFTVEESDRVPGDVDSDGAFTPKDSLRMLMYLAGWTVEINEINGDVDGDGIAGPKDSLRMLMKLAGWDVVLK